MNRLDHPLHLAVYLLNPFYPYGDTVAHDNTTARAIIILHIHVFYHNHITQDVIANVELKKYILRDGLMESIIATKYRQEFKALIS